MNIKLNDLQLILLSTASNRKDGSLLPVPDSIATDTDRTKAAITSLVRRRLAMRSQDHVIITDAGRAAIGTANASGAEKEESPVAAASTRGADASAIAEQCDGVAAINGSIDPPRDIAASLATASAPVEALAPVPARPGSKLALLAELLGCQDGATLSALTSATGWQPHTVRAALSGLRRKGHVIASGKGDGMRIWRIAQ